MTLLCSAAAIGQERVLEIPFFLNSDRIGLGHLNRKSLEDNVDLKMLFIRGSTTPKTVYLRYRYDQIIYYCGDKEMKDKCQKGTKPTPIRVLRHEDFRLIFKNASKLKGKEREKLYFTIYQEDIYQGKLHKNVDIVSKNREYRIEKVEKGGLIFKRPAGFRFVLINEKD